MHQKSKIKGIKIHEMSQKDQVDEILRDTI